MPEPIKVILADDDEDDRLFFEDAFNELKMNTKVQMYHDGVQLMDYINSEVSRLPHILFLDLNMPRKNGIECLKEIRSNSDFKNITIAIYSTSSSEADIENTFALGANIYIKKPDNFNELKKVLTEVLTTSWQFETSGLNKEHFFLRV
ncbi:MAG: response regulator [Cytophagales bacterium]